MEPRIITELVCPDNLPDSPQGNCIVGVGNSISAVCPSTHPYQFPSTSENPFNICAENPDGSGDRTQMVWVCATGLELDPATAGDTVRTNVFCYQVTQKIEQEVQEPCPEGSTLDESRNLCYKAG